MSYDFAGGGSNRIAVGTTAIPTTGSLLVYLKTGATWEDTDGGVGYGFFDVRGAGGIFTASRYLGTWYGGWYDGSTDHRVTAATPDPGGSGSWKAVIVTWDDTANITRLYYDGALLASNTSTLVTVNSAGATRYIGNFDNSGFASAVRGRLAQVCLWNVVITGAQITALSNGTECPQNIAGRVNHWPLIGDALDIVGTDHGTITGATLQASDNPTLTCSGAGPTGMSNLTLLGVG